MDVTTATDAAGSNRDGIERFVNVAISEVIQFRNEVYPAWVRFESEKVGPEVSGNLGFVLPQVLGGCSVLVPDGKFGGLRFGFSTDFNGRVVDYVVEGRPKAVDNIERYSGQFWRKWLSNLCLEDGRPRLRVDLVEQEIWLIFDEVLLDGIELIDVLACACD